MAAGEQASKGSMKRERRVGKESFGDPSKSGDNWRTKKRKVQGSQGKEESTDWKRRHKGENTIKSHPERAGEVSGGCG